MDLGIYTFGDFGKDPKSGAEISAHERIRNLVEEAELADQLGLDVFLAYASTIAPSLSCRRRQSYSRRWPSGRSRSG